jgi:uncharacterized protein YyaL (SSP411 family)
MNHLQGETSPYLLQHADNPVEWYPWGAAALERARAEDKPILLSVGYSACHWCHVMAHESFEHAPTAEIMNRLYINIKVDREERPDLDDIYMQAVQQMTGRGGWPMTVFLLPDGRPFYGGTYYPREARYGMPAFRQILEAVHDAYTKRRADVETSADQLTGSLQRAVLNIGGNDADLNVDLLDAAFAKLSQNYDDQHGGFGSQPKFPQPMNLEFLLRTHARTGDAESLTMATHTLRKMARGGIYDQIGGGFHRYSVDSIWLVPHFEKMLYDNAQLSRVYLHAWQVTGDPFFRRIAEEIYDYILREMTAPDGGFYSTTDADSEGEEGKFFVWSKDELRDLLGDDAPIAIEYFGVTTRGNFEGHNILNVPNDDEIAAARLKIDVATLRTRLAAIKDKLFAVRSQRIAPGLDDKIVTAWNGMMLASLAEAARILDRADYRAAAIRAADFARDHLIHDGRARRTYKDGVAKINGYLEDYANLIDAFVQVYQLTFDPAWFTAARSLADTALMHFRAPDGGFFDTSDDHEALIARPRSLEDNAVPSGTSMLAKGLILLTAYTGAEDYDDAARAGVRQLVAAMREYPQAFGEALNAVDLLVRGVAEVALVGDPAGTETRALLAVLREAYRPNAVIALTSTDVADEDAIPLLSYRTMRAGQPTAYVCRNFACQLPVTTPDALRQQLGAGA